MRMTETHELRIGMDDCVSYLGLSNRHAISSIHNQINNPNNPNSPNLLIPSIHTQGC